MSLEHIPFGALDASHVDALQATPVAEGKRLDYKREIDLSTQEAKKEFLFDVTSFANADGGEIWVGIEEKDGIPTSIPGIPTAEVDALLLKIEDLVRQAVAPRLPSFQARGIPVSTSHSVVVLRVGRSWNAPHMVTLGQTNKFYTRTSAGKHMMDVHELRAVFARAGATREHLLAWRETRVDEVRDGRYTPLTLASGAKAVVHFVPLRALEDPEQVKLDLLDRYGTKLVNIGGLAASYRWNFAGYLTWLNGAGGPAIEYTQLHRDGRIEAVASATYEHQGKVHLRKKFLTDLRAALSKWLELYQVLGVPGPHFLLVAFMDVKGATWQLDSEFVPTKAVDQRDLLFPDFMIRAGESDLDAILKELEVLVQNAVGLPG